VELLEGLTEDELTAQALAADPDEPLAPHAQPFRGDDPPDTSPLPSWYMPPVLAGRSTPGRRVVALTIVGAAFLINALGFCITYGHLTAG
jgi:hypothetical protein